MRRPTVLVLSLLLPLGACATPDPSVLAASCPGTGVLFQASSVTKLRPNGKEPSDAIFAALMGPPVLSCDYDMVDNRVSVDIRFPISLKKGAAPGGTQRLTYFVAVMDSAGNMLTKRSFDRDVDLGRNDTATLTEEVDNTEIKLAQDKKPYDYQILTGFQMTPDELAYNRARRDVRP